VTACGSHVLDTSAHVQRDSHRHTGAGVAPTRNTASGSHILDTSAQSGFGSHVVRGAGVDLLCGGSGYIRYADVYKPHCGDAVVCWELSRVVRCGCREAR